MNLSRNFITPFLTIIFLSVGLSGLLMFLHIADGFTEVVHEMMGMVFLLFVIFHVFINWKSLKGHFGKKYFVLALIIVCTSSVGLIIIERLQPPVDLIVLERVVKAPIFDSFKLLGIDYNKASALLEENGLKIRGAKSIEDIWKRNNSSPKEVVELLIYGEHE